MSSTLTRRPTRAEPLEDDLQVIFIGDDRGLAELYRLKLELDGYWVTIYPTIDGGLEHIRKQTPDLVFVDVGKGAWLISEKLGVLRSEARYQELPIVLLSRGEVDSSRTGEVRLGTCDFPVRVDAVPGEDFWTDKNPVAGHPRHI